MARLAGSCHCGAVAFEAETEVSGSDETLLDCNCSLCARLGYEHWIVPDARFHLLRGRDALTGYRFGTGRAEHLFCRHCGIKAFYRPRSHPDAWSVNLRCVDGVADLRERLVPFDGRDFERARAALPGEEA